MTNLQHWQDHPDTSDEVRALIHDLFQLHYAGLCRFAYRCVRSRAVAEELVQDVFLKVWKQEQAGQSGRVTKGYLYQAVRNHALDHLRHKRVEEAWATRVRLEPEAAEHKDSPDVVLQSEDLAQAVREAVERLPERCRLVFLLRREQHLSYDEIAETLGISIKTVENQMGRALRHLKARLGPYLSLGALVASAAGVLRYVRG